MLMEPADSPKTVTFVGVASEVGDVVTHPAESGQLVEQPPVPESRPLRRAHGHRRMRQEPEGPEAVVERHDHDVAGAGQLVPAVEEACPGPRGEAPTVDPDHDRPPAPVGGGGPHVDAEAVLRLPDRVTRDPGPGHCRGLGCDRAELGGRADPRPGLGRHGRPPPQGPGWAPGVGNAGERPQPVLLMPANPAARDLEHTLHVGTLLPGRAISPAQAKKSLGTDVARGYCCQSGCCELSEHGAATHCARAGRSRRGPGDHPRRDRPDGGGRGGDRGIDHHNDAHPGADHSHPGAGGRHRGDHRPRAAGDGSPQPAVRRRPAADPDGQRRPGQDGDPAERGPGRRDGRPRPARRRRRQRLHAGHHDHPDLHRLHERGRRLGRPQRVREHGHRRHQWGGHGPRRPTGEADGHREHPDRPRSTRRRWPPPRRRRSSRRTPRAPRRRPRQPSSRCKGTLAQEVAAAAEAKAQAGGSCGGGGAHRGSGPGRGGSGGPGRQGGRRGGRRQRRCGGHGLCQPGGIVGEQRADIFERLVPIERERRPIERHTQSRRDRTGPPTPPATPPCRQPSPSSASPTSGVVRRPVRASTARDSPSGSWSQAGVSIPRTADGQ